MWMWPDRGEAEIKPWFTSNSSASDLSNSIAARLTELYAGSIHVSHVLVWADGALTPTHYAIILHEAT